MVKTVAVAYLKYRDARPHGVEERLGRRRLAPVMRHYQHVSLKPVGLTLPELQQLAFDVGFNVGGQQRRAPRRACHFQHA